MERLKREEEVKAKRETDLPEGWAHFTDPKSGHTYYWNEQKQAATWERPKACPQPHTDYACIYLNMYLQTHAGRHSRVRAYM